VTGGAGKDLKTRQKQRSGKSSLFGGYIMRRTRVSVRLRRSLLHVERRGNIIGLSVAAIVAILGFAAFAVDLGFIMHTRTQMQAAADASALAAALELPQGWGPGKTLTAQQTSTNSKTAAQAVATLHRVGEVAAAYLDTSRDVRFGQRTKNAQDQWVESWGVSPYNMVEITVRRDQTLTGNTATRGDQAIPLFFAPVIGSGQAQLTSLATAVLAPGIGFQILSASASATCPLLPIALDETTWNNLINSGIGSDDYKYNSNGTVTSGSDGIKEVNLYPEGDTTLPPGNRGTVDVGTADNSTAVLSRQILYGPNAEDLAYFGGQVKIPEGGTLTLNGDTGLSAAIKDDLTAIIGQPRAIPIFRSVSGPGNNAMYEIVKFVGVRVLYAQLTGSPSNKKVWIQPAPVFSTTIIRGSGALAADSIMAPLQLIH
jgi:Flp pilus assembly protein TadG